MALYKKMYTGPMPKEYELIERDGQKFARWTDAYGRRHTDLVTIGKKGQLKLSRTTKTYLAQYRDSHGEIVVESTGVSDEASARQILANAVKRTQHLRSGIMTEQEVRIGDHSRSSLEAHVEDFLEHLKAKTVRGKRVSLAHRENVKRQLEILGIDCKYTRLSDITRESMERWMNRAEKDGLGPRTRNTYRSAILSFTNWCVESDRLGRNPLAKLCKADENEDRRRTRRALSEDELRRLLVAARLRPLAVYGLDSVPLPEGQRKGHKSWHKELLRFEILESAVQKARVILKDDPALIAELEWLGRERSLIYKTLALTGLRKNELASITTGQTFLDEKRPYLELMAKNEKAGRGAKIPLRSDLADDIRTFMSDKLGKLQAGARKQNLPIPVRLPINMPLFDIPNGLVNIFDRDIVAAGIEKTDELGRTVDVHALRHSFGTHLSKSGVMPRTVQAAMRHSSIHLSMNLYTDPSLLDIGQAVDALPDLALSNEKDRGVKSVG
jgi:integrase